jgi:MbtH protein
MVYRLPLAEGPGETRGATILCSMGARMNRGEQEDNVTYKVVKNHEGQYSIWPADRENASGWRDAGRSGSKGTCLAYIKEVWTDMRPLSLRKQMD